MSGADRLRSWARAAGGLEIPAGQRHLLEDRIAGTARAAGLSLEEVAARIEAGDADLARDCLDALTTNETQWFRDVACFEALADRVIPGILAARGGPPRLAAWSAACSSGQELYSLAMLLDARLPETAADPGTLLLGSDLSTRMVSRAHQGRYTQMEADRGLPARYLVEYFDRDGLSWQVAERIRQRCRFFRHNLAIDPPPGAFDLILCRYVLIYFDEPTRSRVLAQLAAALRPGGALVLGASEMGGSQAAHLRREVVDGVAIWRPRPR